MNGSQIAVVYPKRSIQRQVTSAFLYSAPARALALLLFLLSSCCAHAMLNALHAPLRCLHG